MKIVLRRGTSIIAAVLVIALAISLGGGVPAAVHYIEHDKVTEVLTKGGALVNDPGLNILANRRTSGEVEFHEHTSHVFIVVDGEATLVVGGSMVNPRRTAADQMRAPSAEGGTTYHLSKGDVITIPAKTPHWFKEVPTKTIAFYAVNIESE
ncbi:MAG: hypothetical protein M3O20_01225 [Acidobacteriota bacterium]|nr:hypothetical protein [Acidobacteriota bacterium]